jgi:outer membrane receptor protein involved in Fe transport
MALALLLPPLALNQALAQTDRTLAPVEVIGTTPLPGIGQPLVEIAAPVQSANRRELERSGTLNLGEFLNNAMGSVHVNDMQGNPYQIDVNYRGYTASPLLGTPQGLSVYMDGVRMNQPFGDVVSWDLIPKGAIASLTLMPGSNPLFGLNTLGGALAVQTKDGRRHPGTSLELGLGSHARRSVEFEHGGFNPRGLNWYLNASAFAERGWRTDSPSNVRQLFGKLGWQGGDTALSLTVAHADNQLTGNGLQEQSLLARDFSSVYTKPDETNNTSSFLNLAASHAVGDKLLLSGNLYYRHLKTSTLNGDINEDALESAIYQPSAGDQAALAGAGYTGFPLAGANAANTPFPFWNCIAQVLQNDEPVEACSGLNNRTRTTQHNHGLSGQLTWLGELAGRRNQFTLGAGYDASRVNFEQTAELGYLNADRSVTGTGAFADGVSGGNLNGVPYDTRVNLASSTQTWSLFASNTWSITDGLHLSLAGRYNRTNVDNLDQLRPVSDPATLTANHQFDRFNPAIGITWSPSKTLNAYLGYSESSRAPTAIELGCANPLQPCRLPNAMAGDPPLNQVVTRTVEAGVRGSLPGFSAGNPWQWSAGVFRAENSDDILFVAANAGGFGYFKNFGQTRRQGVELGASGKVGAFTLGAHYTWLDATYQSAETVNGTGNSSNDQALAGNPGVDGNITIQPGDRIPLVPQHLLKLSARYAAASTWGLSASMVAVSGSLARGNENAQHASDGTFYQGPGASAGYAVFNLGADWRPKPKLQLSAQINNLFDLRYATAAQLGANAFNAAGAVNADPFGNGSLPQSTFFAPGAPRALSVSLKYVFD